MTDTTTTSLANAIQTYFQKRLLMVFRKEMRYQDFAMEKKLTNTNSTRFIRIEKIARATQKSEGVPSTPVALSTNFLECTLKEFGTAIRLTDWAQHDVITGDMIKIATDRIGLSMAEAADWDVAATIAKHGWRVRQGLDSNLRAKGTASSGSTTSLVCSALAGSFSDDDFNGSTLLVYEGTNKGIARKVADFTASSCTFDFTGDAFPQAIDSTSKFVCYSIKSMDQDFKIDSDSLKKIMAIGKSRGMKRIGGAIQVIIPSFIHCDFFDDPIFKEQSINIPNSRFQQDTIGRWFNMQFSHTDQPYTENSSGAVDEDTPTRIPIPIIGADSYSICRKTGGQGKFAIETFIVDTPDSVNIDNSYSTVSAKMRFVAEVTQAEWMPLLYTAYNSYF